jgi:SAM-dependent methyltransferase
MTMESVIHAPYVESVDARLASVDAYIEYQIQEGLRALPFLSRYIDPQGAEVLEIGAGLGGKGIAYALAGMRVTSLDLDLVSLGRAVHAAQARDAEVRFLSADGTRLPFPGERFQAVLLDSVVEHVADPAALVQECARVLKPGGIAFVVFPPYYGPLSGHIDDYVLIPWFHLLPRRTVERFLLAQNKPKGILTPGSAFQVYASLNHLTIHGFKRMARRAGLRLEYMRVRPFLTHPGTRLLVGLAAAIAHPPRKEQVRATLERARREFDLGTALTFVLLLVIAPLVYMPLVQEIAAGGCKAVLRKPRGVRVG